MAFLPSFRGTRSHPPLEREEPLPVGRLFDTQLVSYHGRGLGVAGAAAVLAVRQNVRSIVTASSMVTDRGAGRRRPMPITLYIYIIHIYMYIHRERWR